MTQIAQHNPWKGVVPYTGDPEDLKLHPFCGRDKDIEKLLDIIDGNEITTMYGRSGIGKTSLINAGLFPRLRDMDCYPISIRLFSEDTQIPYARIITDALANIAQPRLKNEKVIPCEDTNINFLWRYFGNHTFVQEGIETTPVIVLDQFEETLRNNRNGAILLLKQLRRTQEDGVLEDGTPYSVNFRFVISLREDDLFLLEDALDDFHIDKMKNSRYRLQPIEPETAIREIIHIREGLYAGSDVEIDMIEQKLVHLATQDNNVSSILLSLVCSMAYEAAAGGPITLESLKKIGDNPLITYYQQCIKDLPEDFIEFLETQFIDGDRRRIVYIDPKDKRTIKMVKQLADEKNDHRLLTKASDATSHANGYELLHDKLAEAIHQYTSERNVARKKNRLTRILYAFVAIILIISGIFLYSKRPNVFLGDTDFKEQPIPVNYKPYVVPDGCLRLNNCIVKPYTFYGNKEVTKLVLNKADLQDNALFLPNVDTLIIGQEQWQYVPGTLQEALPNVKTIIAQRPLCSVAKAHKHLPSLQNCIIQPQDEDLIHWDQETKTLFARQDTTSSWVSYLSAYSKMLYSDHSFLMGKKIDAFRLVEIDLAQINRLEKYDDNTYYKLINTDSTITAVNKADIPDDIRKRIFFIDMPYVLYIGERAFNNNDYMRKVNLPHAQEIGEDAFYNNYELTEISLPKVRKINKYAFYNTAWTRIELDSLTELGAQAIVTSNSANKIEKIYLPSIQTMDDNAFGYSPQFANNMLLEYNSNSESAKNLFGTRKQTSDISISNTDKAMGYHLSHSLDTLYLDSLYIPDLHISKSTFYIRCENNKEYQIDNVSLELGNPAFYEWRGDIYYYRGDSIILFFRTSRNSLVSLPSNAQFIERAIIPTTGQWKEFICLDRSCIDQIKHPEKMTLFVPYGQMDKFKEIGNKFSDMQELNWLQTIWYNLFYSYAFMLPWKVLRFLGAEISDIWAFISGFLILLLLAAPFIILSDDKRKWLRFAIITDILVLVACGLILVSPIASSFGIQYICSDGECFHTFEDMFTHLKESNAVWIDVRISMWRMLWYAIPTFIMACIIKVRRDQFKTASRTRG